MLRLPVGLALCVLLPTIAIDSAVAADNATMPSSAKASTPASPFRLMSAAKDARLRSYLPEVEDESLRELLSDPRLILYTETEMPRAYQDWDGALQGVHSAYYNISADGGEPYGNGNREFPWGSPAGTHRVKNLTSFRFMRLPLDEQGKPLPVVWYRKRLPRDTSDAYVWTFPVGTVFGEVLRQHGPDGKDYTFEVRLRYREYGKWTVDVLRPFPTAKDLARAVKQLRPEWEASEQLAALVEHLETPLAMQKLKLTDKHPVLVSFKQSMGVDSLPEVGDDKLVAELLTTTPFRSALGEDWRRSLGGVRACAPTTDAPFHIVPANYDAGFVDADSISCMRCHETVGHHVREFQPYRDWYGRVRGSDAIFSFHPFSTSCVSNNGFGQTVKLRPELVKAGLLEQYDDERHPARVYQQLEN